MGQFRPFLKKEVINSISFGIKKSIFQSGNVPTRHEIINGQSQFFVGLSYQNQYFPLLKRSEAKQQPENVSDTCSGFIITVRGMEILRRRNKPSNPCKDYVDDEANEVLVAMADKLKCKPRHWDISSPHPDCTERQLNISRQLLGESLYNNNARHLNTPCRSIIDLWYDYDFDNSAKSCTDDDENTQITVVFNNLPFKEISFVKSYTLWNVLSGIGVIVGFFFGFSLIQLPDLVQKLLKRVDYINGYSIYDKEDGNRIIALLKIEMAMLKKEISLLKLPIVNQLRTRKFETKV